MTAIDTLTIVREQSARLIRCELSAAGERDRLERACVQAIRKLGQSVDEVSEASGLTPSEIRSLLDETKPLDTDLAALAGMR